MNRFFVCCVFGLGCVVKGFNAMNGRIKCVSTEGDREVEHVTQVLPGSLLVSPRARAKQEQEEAEFMSNLHARYRHVKSTCASVGVKIE